jgi:hypothetical protein
MSTAKQPEQPEPAKPLRPRQPRRAHTPSTPREATRKAAHHGRKRVSGTHTFAIVARCRELVVIAVNAVRSGRLRSG